ncbi:MAG: carboxypeptidase regulatory-like domain-containing protein [Gammaproteobacteria bacterium]|nr:carboxypeptidase regulatory-like domain-containing protein [Gammaproteobacteria bacterium]MDH3804597.1 carboxypeptidase regulatory-like domain-containing protein [Gammaproteobacteria bacterium]
MNRVINKLLPLAALLVLPMMAQAQDTASAMRGRILDQMGAPVAGASVVVVDQRTGVARTYTSNDTGTFLAARLPVGGPYRVIVNNAQSIDVPSIALGETYNLTVNLLPPMEEIIATGQAQEYIETAPGPTATFGLMELDSAVAFNRDIKDVYASDPRLNLDGFETNCAGKHPRFNSVTLDGVSHNDRFGLNTNGYSTATGMPFPFDAIEQVAVELAPYDVNYGGFSACNINAVTKSGGNEWEANAFYEYTTQDLVNDELDGADFTPVSDYTRDKKGLTVGGPIIKDRLFFFAAYEETEEPQNQAIGFAGSGNGEERSWLSEADYNTINDFASSQYQYDTGGMPGNNPQEDENYMVRLDWNINDSHDVAVIYNYYDGFRTNCSDSDPEEFEFANHCYVKGAESETTTLIFSSQWTDTFSTEVFYSDNDMNDSQVTVGAKDIGDHQIEIGENTVYLGADDSRQANNLFTRSEFLKLSGQFLLGDHVISAGYEVEDVQVFNIFVQHSVGGEWDYYDESGGNPAACDALDAQGRYDDWVLGGAGIGCSMSGLDKFLLGRPSNVYYGSGGTTNNALDAAADFTNSFNALYVQDEIYFPNQDLTLTAGLRYAWIDSSDHPNFNSVLSSAIGIRNDVGLDGLDVIMPRVGFNWGIRDDLTLRGGIGLFSGGNPFVWLSNGWSNDGVTNVQESTFYQGLGHPSTFDGGIPLEPGAPGGQIPTELFDAVANTGVDSGSTSRTNLIDPDYETPQEWKLSMGGTWDMPWWGLTMDFDYMYTQLEDGALYQDVSQEIVGQTLAGAPIYDVIPGAGDRNLMLTNAKDDSTAHVVSLVFNKSFDWGMDLLFGYAYTDAEDVSPMTSFTAGSSFSSTATNNINFPESAPSNYNVKTRLTLRASFAREFWGDNSTRFTLMGYYSEGQPGTYTIDSRDVLQFDRGRNNPLYVPDGPSDPNVVYDPAFPQAEFFDWIDKRKLSPGFIPRNSIDTKVSWRADLRIDQEIPLGVDDLKARAYLKIYNFSNLLNDDWGRQYDASFFTVDVVDVAGLTPEGAYIYEDFSARSLSELQSTRSLWEMRLGLEVNFR